MHAVKSMVFSPCFLSPFRTCHLAVLLTRLAMLYKALTAESRNHKIFPLQNVHRHKYSISPQCIIDVYTCINTSTCLLHTRVAVHKSAFLFLLTKPLTDKPSLQMRQTCCYWSKKPVSTVVQVQHAKFMMSGAKKKLCSQKLLV